MTIQDDSLYYLIVFGAIGLIVLLALMRVGSPINWNDIAPACPQVTAT